MFLVGIFFILNSTVKINFFGDIINYNSKNEELQGFDFSYQQLHLHTHLNHTDNNSSLDKTENNVLYSLPEDLYLIQDVNIKKDKFINSLLPLIIAENKKILSFRYQIKIIYDSLNLNKTLNKSDQIFIENMASKFFVKTKNRHKIDVINELLDLIDVIPNSIVLAQAANESGWGSSRFARDFNALFGQYTYDNNNGIKPSLREEGEKHLIKFFPTINQSIESYFININTHIAYYDFREKRKHLRENDLSLDPSILVKTLDSYAEDKNYVDTIISIIKANQLTQYDSLKTI